MELKQLICKSGFFPFFQKKKKLWASRQIKKKKKSAASSCEASTAHLHILIFIQIFMELTIWMNECYRWLPRSFRQKLKLCLLLWKNIFWLILRKSFVNMLESENVLGFVLYKISFLHINLCFCKFCEKQCQFLITRKEFKDLRLESEYLGLG